MTVNQPWGRDPAWRARSDGSREPHVDPESSLGAGERSEYERIMYEDRRYILHSWSVQGRLSNSPIARAQGSCFWDLEGRRFLDFSSQLVCCNIGHGHPRVIEAIARQARQFAYAAPFHAADVRGTLARLIVEHTPGPLYKVFFTLSGSESNENALKIARMVTGRHKVLARYNSYHGATSGSITLTGDERRPPVEPGIPGIVHFLDPFCHHCPFGHVYPACGLRCVDHVRQVLEYEDPSTVAAIFVEPVVGANGVQVPPPEYLPELRRICDRYGILLVADEVMTGWGRTGAWFACERLDVVPDILTMAKGLTSAYLPLGAVVVNERIARYFDDHMLWSGLTYSGHPLACAAGIATIQTYEEEGLIERARRLEPRLLARLRAMKDRHPIVGDVRGLGLFAAVELAVDAACRGAEDGLAAAMSSLRTALHEAGVYVYIRKGNLIIAPPLSISDEELETGLEGVEQGLVAAESAV